MNKTLAWTLGIFIVLLGGYFITSQREPEAPVMVSDYKNIEYVIAGEGVKLTDGISEKEAAIGSASKIATRYFGNELRTDLDNNGREDVVFLLTQETGGSGIFYYVVAAMDTPQGYVGSDGYFLGDRVAPQTTEVSRDPKYTGAIVVNYADRKPDEAMTTQPSLGKSVYLTINPETMRWSVAVPR